MYFNDKEFLFSDASFHEKSMSRMDSFGDSTDQGKEALIQQRTNLKYIQQENSKEHMCRPFQQINTLKWDGQAKDREVIPVCQSTYAGNTRKTSAKHCFLNKQQLNGQP